ncbi:MAG: hypothetical protein HW419_3166 [Deltaproteobacteria bacterium]|nr:hypothetical protein [Deltaproteobacteria bacterium]
MSEGNAPEFGISKNVRLVGRTDLAGGGQVVVENGYAYVGHMDPPHGTTILDVKDPKHPKVVAQIEIQIEIPQGVHSHKVRVSGDVMLVNLERYRGKEKLPTGLKIYDIANREKPKEIAFFETNGGVHRFTFDGRYAYISVHLEGYIGRIPMILIRRARMKLPAGGCPVSGSAAARRRPGKGRRTSAIIRFATAIGSTSVIGTAASSFSISPT